MVFKHLAKFGKSKNIKAIVKKPKKRIDVLKDVRGIQTRSSVKNILMSLIRNRHSVRSYKPKNVSESDILEIIEAATCAPSAGNQQPWEFIIVRDKEIKQHIVNACFNQEWMLEAPVFIVACINSRISSALYGERGLRLYGIQSVAAAIENILLAAEALGLGACWVGAFDEMTIATLLKCPDYIRPCAIITLGYSNEPEQKPKRHDVSNVIHLEEFGETYYYKNIKRAKHPLF
ncbi:MAG: nitroreductase family protein [Candidatus Aenigmarchaeota archaeon]|nr:nitroreductase family protein [Candidatus Aenigmarchaeota archaeon]